MTQSKSTPSLLEQLDASIEEQLQKRTPRAPVEPIDVDGRPGWTFEYGTRLTYEDYQALVARNALPDGGTHAVNLGADVAVLLCRGMTLNGQKVTDETGKPVTFGSPVLMQRLGATSATDCVRRVYVDEEGEPDEAGIAALGNALLLITGWLGRRPTRRP